MDPITWIIIAVVVGIILLRIFFKLAKFVVIIALLIVAAVFIWNAIGNTTP
jgi:hypothetical protein